MEETFEEFLEAPTVREQMNDFYERLTARDYDRVRELLKCAFVFGRQGHGEGGM